MPEYSVADIRYIIRADDFHKMYGFARNLRERVLLTLLWLTGARTSEILNLKKKDIQIEEDRIRFSILTEKLPKGKFVVERRNLILKVGREEYYIKDLEQYLSRLKDESKLFSFTRRTMVNIIHRISNAALGITLCPYNFRHSRITLLTEAGRRDEELMRFKGCRSLDGVRPYQHARKVEYDIEVSA